MPAWFIKLGIFFAVFSFLDIIFFADNSFMLCMLILAFWIYISAFLWLLLSKLFDKYPSNISPHKNFNHEDKKLKNVQGHEKNSKSTQSVSPGPIKTTSNVPETLQLPNTKAATKDLKIQRVIVTNSVKKSKTKSSNLQRALFQNRHFHPIPLEGNLSDQALKYFNDKINEANNSSANNAIKTILDIPDHLKGLDKKVVNDFITSSMFSGPTIFYDPHFNKDLFYDFYYWKIVSTNQVFFIDMVVSGEKPQLYENDFFYKKKINYIYNKYQTIPVLLESSIPGTIAEKELDAICNIAQESGNLLLNKGYGYESDYYFNVKTHKDVKPESIYSFLTRPVHLVTQFDYLYNDQKCSYNKWDKLEKEKLKQCGTCNNIYAVKILCRKKTKKSKKLYYIRLNKLKKEVSSIIQEELHGHIYKSVGKRPTCVIVFTDIYDDSFSEYRNRGLAIYHAFDILKFFDRWDAFVKFCNNHKK